VHVHVRVGVAFAFNAVSFQSVDVGTNLGQAFVIRDNPHFDSTLMGVMEGVPEIIIGNCEHTYQ
jgi:hypothetical protein